MKFFIESNLTAYNLDYLHRIEISRDNFDKTFNIELIFDPDYRVIVGSIILENKADEKLIDSGKLLNFIVEAVSKKNYFSADDLEQSLEEFVLEAENENVDTFGRQGT